MLAAKKSLFLDLGPSEFSSISCLPFRNRTGILPSRSCQCNIGRNNDNCPNMTLRYLGDI